ncbi:hypothetical protein DRO19_00005, partial [Candidatus Bathyarchaeota archaeon]
HYKWVSAPQWVWDGSAYVPYIFKDRYASEGYYQVQTGLIGARIYDYYATFYDPNMSEVRLYDERWEVQRYRNGKWNDIGAQSGAPIFKISQSETCINITKSFHSWAGWLNITYCFREGSPLKHTVVFKSEIAEATTFRIIQKWAGIVAAKVKHAKGEDTITSAKTIDSPWFRFEKADGSLSVYENQWSMYYGFNETTGEVYVLSNHNLKPVEIDVHARGLKADFVFGNWTLASGERLIIDPETATLSPPLRDTFADEYNPDLDRESETYLLVANKTGYSGRAYILFNLSSIPSDAWISSALLKLYHYGGTGTVGEQATIQARRVTSNWTTITWNNQPSFSSEITAETTVTFGNYDWYSWEIKSDVQMWVNGSCPNYGTVLLINVANSPEFYFYSQEYDGYDPQLEVTYTANQPPNGPTLDSPANATRFNPSANVTFNWTFSDADAGDSQSAFQFQLDDNSDFSSPIIDTGKVSSSTSSTTQTLPSTVGLYYWRVKTWDSYDAEGSWSSSRTLIVDKLNVTFTVSPENPQAGDKITLSWTIKREYDGSTVTNFTIDIARDGALWMEDLTVNNITDYEEEEMSHTYDVYAGTVVDLDYGLNTWDSTPITVTWTGTGGGGGSLPPAPEETPAPTPTSEVTPPMAPSNLVVVGVLIIVGIVSFAVASSEAKPKISVSRRKWSSSRRRALKKRVKWRKPKTKAVKWRREKTWE